MQATQRSALNNNKLNKNMKTYSIVVTVIACLSLAAAAYFFVQYNGLSSQMESCQTAKAGAETQLSDAQEQLLKVRKTNAVLISALDSFMIPGDTKALTIGSQEATGVEQKIADVADSKDRMMMETNWADFKSTKLLNSLFNFFRDAANNIERTLAPKS